MSVRLAGVLSLVLTAAAAAQERRDTTRADTAAARVPDLVVRAATPVTTVGGSSAVRVRPDSLVLPSAPTLEQVLRVLPSLHVRRNSRGEAEVSVRGSGSRQVAVLVDGVPLTLAWDARADLSVIPATAPTEIAVTRGQPSMLHGPNVLGGVVELSVGQSLLQPPGPAAELAADLDHLGGAGGKGTVTLPLAAASGQWLARAGLGFRSSPGQPLARGVVEPAPAARDLRVNTDARSVDGFAAVRYHDHSGTWVSVSGSWFDAERGIAAELGVDNARFWRYPAVRRGIAVATAGTGERRSPFGGYGDLEASVGVDVGRTEIESYASRSYTDVNGFEHGDDRTLTLRLLGDQTLGPRGDLRAAFTLADIRHDESLPEGDARYRQRLWSLGGETVWRIVEHGTGVRFLRVTVGGAYDVGATPETGGREALGRLAEWGARAGFTMGVGTATGLHAGVSRRARFPALRELYSGALNRFAPNPGLRPENLVAIEAGVTTRAGRDTELQLTAFAHRMSDAVARIVLPDARFMRINRDRLDSRGVELLASTRLGPVGASADVTVQSVDLTDTGLGQTTRPENLPEIFGGVRTAVPLPFRLRADLEARHTGRQYCVHPGTGQDTALDAGTLFHGAMSRRWDLRPGGAGWWGRLETRVAVDNAGDAALYDQCGLPRPGRLVRLQVRIY